MRTALTIAGSDSGAGAGIQADLKTFAAHGVYGLSAVTAVTAQNSLGVTMVQAMPADLVTAQIEAVVSDFGTHAAKTGMLATSAIVEAVAAAVRDLEIPSLVVDPVMVAKSGDHLLDPDAVDAMKTELIGQALLVTPNIPEAEVLSGIPIETDADRREAARRIAAFGATAVVIKGGHAPTDDIADLLYTGGDFIEFRHPRVSGHHTHGTGCTFAAAITSHLALGHDLQEALASAQRFVAEAIRHAPDLGRGHGPMNHFFRLRSLGVVLLASVIALGVSSPLKAQDLSPTTSFVEDQQGTDVLGAFVDSLKLLMLEHGVRVAFQEKTRRGLDGPFWLDYKRSVRHAIHGAAAGYLWLDHSPDAPREFRSERSYWASRGRAAAWAAGYSLQFEWGPLSEASSGNVGMDPTTTGWVDQVVTPAGAFGLMVAEDALDKWVVKKVERRVHNPVARLTLRMFFHPARALSNTSSGRWP